MRSIGYRGKSCALVTKTGNSYGRGSMQKVQLLVMKWLEKLLRALGLARSLDHRLGQVMLSSVPLRILPPQWAFAKVAPHGLARGRLWCIREVVVTLNIEHTGAQCGPGWLPGVPGRFSGQATYTGIHKLPASSFQCQCRYPSIFTPCLLF